MNRSNYASPLARPDRLPLKSIETLTTTPVLVVAPHPDDETLGCGGAIALLRSQGRCVRLLVISDGTQSHPNSRKYPARSLQQLRAAETQAAMAILGVAATEITRLHLPDGAVPTAGVDFHTAIARCCSYLAAFPPQLVLLPWRSDPHPDHRATWQILTAALTASQLTPRTIEYPIWDWDPAQRQSSDLEQIEPWRLDISAVVERKQQAIAAYRSQISDLIDDDPTGFRLSPELLSNFAQPWEIYLEQNHTYESC